MADLTPFNKTREHLRLSSNHENKARTRNTIGPGPLSWWVFYSLVRNELFSPYRLGMDGNQHCRTLHRGLRALGRRFVAWRRLRPRIDNRIPCPRNGGRQRKGVGRGKMPIAFPLIVRT